MTIGERPDFVFIQGTAYSGSTLLSFALGALDGVLSLGETNWIARGEVDGCGVCGRRGTPCSVFTADRWARLQSAGPRLYRVLRDVMPAELALVVSDKYPCLWQKHSRDLAADRVVPLVVFKSPYAQVWSFRKNAGRGNALQCPPLPELLDRMEAVYRFRLIGKHPPILCDFERLIADPHRVMRSICGRLGVAYHPHAYERYWEAEQHQIGGNRGPWARLVDPKAAAGPPLRDGHVVSTLPVDHRWRDHLDAATLDAIASHPYMAVYHRMVKAFAAQLHGV